MQLLNSLLTSYSLYSIIGFPTRIHNNSHTMVCNIFINKFKNESYSVYFLINGLSDHDAQVLSLYNINLTDDGNEFYFYRKILNTCEMNSKLALVMKHGRMYSVIMIMIKIQFLIMF
jgi:hypothetical protein